MAMDRHDKEKEVASVFLSALYADVISSVHISQGSVLLLEAADDLVVGILDAVDILSLFVARAVVDDILPPAFLSRGRKVLPESSKGVQVIQTAERATFQLLIMQNLWRNAGGGSTHVTVEEVKKSEEGIVSSSQNFEGFGRLSEALDDLSLDIPSAKVLFFESLVPKAISGGWLNSSFLISSGENGDAKGEDTEKARHFKEDAATIIHENFHSDDISELIHSLEELAAPEFYPAFLKKLTTLAMDRKNGEKEMAFVLLSALHTEIFSSEDTVCGFVLLLETADDTALDVLDASNELALFLARAVIDDVLIPFNLEEICSKLPPNCSGAETVHMAR
ncbi:hypothetical protein MKX03_033808 [Papaver bracteatum]|nr:hypothetical protein MKX03_033808 [Papaver bracteatum]